MKRWEVLPIDDEHFAALMDGAVVLKVHPIGFASERDAERGVARLNKEQGYE